MAIECLVLAVCLRAVLELQSTFLQGLVVPAGQTVALSVEHAGPSVSERLGNLIMFLGAGIYEELLFRLVLLSGTIWVLRRLGVELAWSVVYGVALTSLAFAAAHYVGPYGDLFDPRSFLFRFIAGLFFCILFVYRGFGIAAGTHALYDILVGLLPS